MEFPNLFAIRILLRPLPGSLVFLGISNLRVGLVELAQPSAIVCSASGAITDSDIETWLGRAGGMGCSFNGCFACSSAIAFQRSILTTPMVLRPPAQGSFMQRNYPGIRSASKSYPEAVCVHGRSSGSACGDTKPVTKRFQRMKIWGNGYPGLFR